jgi:hypothetical protein
MLMPTDDTNDRETLPPDSPHVASLHAGVQSFERDVQREGEWRARLNHLFGLVMGGES